MKDLVTPFKVGVVVLAGIVIALWMFGQVREGIGDDPNGYRVSCVFDDVSGLVEKSRVSIAGINVGQIDKIELAGERARVWLRVNTPLRADATVYKKQASLLGEYYLQLTPGALGDPLKDGDEIKNILTDTAPADLMNELKVIAENVREVTGSVRTVVAGKQGEQKLAQILDNINASVAEINRLMAANGPKVDTIVDNVVEVTNEATGFTEDFRRDAKLIMADVKAVTNEVRSIVGKNSGNVEEGFASIKGAVARLQTAMDKLDGTLDRTQSIATKIDNGQGTIGRLVNDDKLIDSLTDVVDESSRFIKKITRLQTIVALRSEYYLGETAVKNYFSLKLQPKPDKYYMLQLIDDPRGRTMFRETVTSTTDSTKNPVIREQETITEDRFRFSLQYAKRFYFVTGRIGIIENTGGVGVDVHLLDDDLELSGDIFAFDENVNPRVKLWGLYTFFTHLYVAAGIDDVWNDEETDFFIGAGISFNDDDLKALITTTGAPSL
jgi:phospholipid/cholesterol/gamma-HCH transport system substrate-binding protein